MKKNKKPHNRHPSKNHRPPSKNGIRPGWVTYSRCFFMTAGALFISLVAAAFYFEGHEREEWPGWSYLVLAALLVAGIGSIGIGLFSSRKKAASWMESSTSHEGSFIVMLLAAPLYFLLKAFERKR